MVIAVGSWQSVAMWLQKVFSVFIAYYLKSLDHIVHRINLAGLVTH